jgi:DNA-binding PadR family transcriptional regulator
VAKYYRLGDSGQAEKEENMLQDLLIFGGWLGLLTIIAVIDEIIKKRKKVRK